MAKVQETAEGWGGVDEFVGAGDLTVLSDDGDVVSVAIVGPPVALTSDKFQKESKRVIFPVLSDGQLSAMPVGARVYRKISKYQKRVKEVMFTITRHGAAGDTETKYEVQTGDMTPAERDMVAKVQAADVKAVMLAGVELLS